MDLELDENQRAIADLGLEILRESLTRERLRAIEATDDRVGADEWKRLAHAGLLGVPLAEDVGGRGSGSSRPVWSSSRSGARSRRCPTSTRWSGRQCRSTRSGALRNASVSCRGSATAR